MPIVPLFLRRLQLSFFSINWILAAAIGKGHDLCPRDGPGIMGKCCYYSGPIPDEEFADKTACEHAIQGANLVPPFRGRKSRRMGR